MKTRNGFVSNSSSSSFIVTIPENFVVTDELVNNSIFADLENVREVIESFIEDGYINGDEDYDEFRIISNLYDGPLSEFQIADIEGGADGGDSYNIVEISELKKIIEKSNNYKA